jgi:asparagine synthase (glutamine-hydrolysing)
MGRRVSLKSAIAVLHKRDGNAKLSHHNAQHWVHSGGAAVLFNGRIYSPTSGISGSEIIAKKLQQADPLKTSENFIQEFEGDFAFVIIETKRIIAGRDPMGVQPLYYGENNTVAALAANRKALWKLEIEETKPFPPGHLAFVNREGFNFKPVKTFVYAEPKQISLEKAAKTLQKLLEKSVQKRVSGMKEVAIAFSGGLDSSVVAFLAKKCSINVQLFHVSLEKRPETEEAKKAAEELKLPLQVYLFKEEDVEKVVSRVVNLIEEPDPVKASIGVPFYWTAEKTAEAGIKVLLAGQGADELFGGYHRYVNEYLSHGERKVRKTMFDDVVRLHKSNIERDSKICSYHDVELRLPFAAYQIAEFAVTLPVKLKIAKQAYAPKKIVLRKAAKNMGLPASITEKPKKAVQYTTGINKALKKIAKKKESTLAEYVGNLFLSQMTEN